MPEFARCVRTRAFRIAVLAALPATLAGCIRADVATVVVTPNDTRTSTTTFTVPGGAPLSSADPRAVDDEGVRADPGTPEARGRGRR